MHNRAQSEAVGFILVFAVIVSTVALVSVLGYAEVQEVERVERVNNAERAFVVLAGNVDDVVRNGVPSRSTQMRLSGERLYLGEPIDIRIQGEHHTEPSETFEYTYQVRPVVFDADTGERVVYVAGAVIREGGHGVVMVREPGLLLSSEQSVLPLVVTESDGNRSIGGGTSVAVNTQRAGAELLHGNATGYKVTVEVRSPRADAWYQYLDALPDVTCTRPSNETISCVVTTDRVYASAVTVSMTFA